MSNPTTKNICTKEPKPSHIAAEVEEGQNNELTKEPPSDTTTRHAAFMEREAFTIHVLVLVLVLVHCTSTSTSTSY